jgi:hypothetical protein
LGFRVGTHPLLRNKDDIPAFLEIQKAKFEELKALDVDTEHKMHPGKFMEIIMTCVGRSLRAESQTYTKQLNTQQPPFTFEQLQAIVSTYEGSNSLMRTKSTAYLAAAMHACGHSPAQRPEPQPQIQPGPDLDGRGRWMWTLDTPMQDTNRIIYRRRNTKQHHWGYWRLAETTIRCSSGAGHTNTPVSGFNGSNRYISSANPGAENRVDMNQMQGIPEHRHSNSGINPFQSRPSAPRLSDRERSHRDQPHCPIRLAERGRGRSRSHENTRTSAAAAEIEAVARAASAATTEAAATTGPAAEIEADHTTWCVPISRRRMAVDRT